MLKNKTIQIAILASINLISIIPYYFEVYEIDLVENNFRSERSNVNR